MSSECLFRGSVLRHFYPGEVIQRIGEIMRQRIASCDVILSWPEALAEQIAE